MNWLGNMTQVRCVQSKTSVHNKCAWVGIHQWLWKVKGNVLSIIICRKLILIKEEQFSSTLYWIIKTHHLLYCTKKNTSYGWSLMTMQQVKNINKTDTYSVPIVLEISSCCRKKTATKTSNMFKIVPRIGTYAGYLFKISLESPFRC